MKDKGWSSKFPFFYSVPLLIVSSNEYKLSPKKDAGSEEKLVRTAVGENVVRLQAIASHSWENSSTWCVPQNIPSLEKPPMTLRMLKNSRGYTKKWKNTWQPQQSLKYSTKR